MLKRHNIALIFVSLLAGCGDPVVEPGPGGVSEDDARALDAAAAKLDAEATPPTQPDQR
jgi:hypothetical protein